MNVHIIYNNLQIMKNIRSSKLLKPMDPQTKQQSQLRMKVRILQQQVSLLQKSNLNIFIPLSQHPNHDTPVDYQSIIAKLRQQLLASQQENTGLKGTVKKLQKQKLEIKAKYQKQVEEFMRKIGEIQKQKEEIIEEFDQLKQLYNEKCKQCEQLDRLVIQKNVELKFVNQDLKQQRIRKQSLQKQLKDIKHKISEVIYSTRVYNSIQVKCICIEKVQYDELKQKIADLQAQIRALIDASKRQKITLGVRKSDIGEQIVRLKKNIDMQLGIQGNSKHSEEFLKVYKGTHDMFDQLIKKCQP